MPSGLLHLCVTYIHPPRDSHTVQNVSQGGKSDRGWGGVMLGVGV